MMKISFLLTLFLLISCFCFSQQEHELGDMIHLQLNTDFENRSRMMFEKMVSNQDPDLVELKKNLDMNSSRTNEIILSLSGDKTLFAKYSECLGYAIYKFTYYNYYLKKKYLSGMIQQMPDSTQRNYISLLLVSAALFNGDKSSVTRYSSAITRSMSPDPYYKSLAAHFTFRLDRKDYSEILKQEDPDVVKYYYLYELSITKNRKLIPRILQFEFPKEFSAVAMLFRTVLDDSGKLDLVLLEKLRNSLNYLNPAQQILLYEYLKDKNTGTALLQTFFDGPKGPDQNMSDALSPYESKDFLTLQELNFIEELVKGLFQQKTSDESRDRFSFRAADLFLKHGCFDKAFEFYKRCTFQYSVPAKLKMTLMHLQRQERDKALKLFKSLNDADRKVYEGTSLLTDVTRLINETEQH